MIFNAKTPVLIRATVILYFHLECLQSYHRFSLASDSNFLAWPSSAESIDGGYHRPY